MAELELILFDDDVARNWYPFTRTRPAGEMLLGSMTLRERLEAVTGAVCAGYLTSALLSGFDEPEAPPVIDASTAPIDCPRLLLSSRCVLHFDVELDLASEATYRVGDQIAGWLLPEGAALPDEAELHHPRMVRGEEISLGGKLLEHVWDLLHHNLDHVASDILHRHPSSEPSQVPEHADVIGKYPIICGADVTVEPGVVFDVSGGPVWLDDGVKVRAFSRVAGPMYVGKDTTLLGGSFTGSSIGPMCKVRGEIEESIFLGYSNKAHEGFLGHAIVGKWVNLGAGTTNSDLKNNYSSIRIYTPRGEIDTGLVKLGSLIGDHVKTAIGTLLTTGAVIGPGANLLGGLVPKHVPSFSWGGGTYQIDKFLETTDRAMRRRAVELSKSQREMLSRVWHARHLKG
jgi:UDP-N-acetylglucosamine diphosphorylase/glucosamine-1-phosphate N-acetyltransferase